MPPLFFKVLLPVINAIYREFKNSVQRRWETAGLSLPFKPLVVGIRHISGPLTASKNVPDFTLAKPKELCSFYSSFLYDFFTGPRLSVLRFLLHTLLCVVCWGLSRVGCVSWSPIWLICGWVETGMVMPEDYKGTFLLIPILESSQGLL